jgi:sodium transport system permease protein
LSAPGFGRAVRAVWLKELRENARDRRTLLSALVLGPLVAPLLFALMMQVSIERGAELAGRTLRLRVENGALAPSLMEYLAGQGVELVPLEPPADARALVLGRAERLVLRIGVDYAERLRKGLPAPVELLVDSSRREVDPERRRIEGILAAYGQTIGALRLRARGIDPSVGAAMALRIVDVASAASRGTLVLSLLSYFLLLALLVGGLYIAIDTTAGERERGSLEPLLTTPASRASLLTGKIAAASTFMALSLAVSVAAFALALTRVKLSALGMEANLGPWTAFLIFAVMLPFVPLGASLLTLVASYTKSYREAQTWLSVVLLVPTLPIAFAAIYAPEPRALYYAVPSLGQHLLITRLLRAEGLPPGAYALAALGSLAGALLLFGLALRRWRQESLLG